MSKQDYKPVSCDFYDQLEDLSTRKEVSKITFRDENGKEVTEKGLIKDLYTREKVEYLLLDNSSEIRLDRISGVEEAGS